jgi:hypothetical protein
LRSGYGGDRVRVALGSCHGNLSIVLHVPFFMRYFIILLLRFLFFVPTSFQSLLCVPPLLCCLACVMATSSGKVAVPPSRLRLSADLQLAVPTAGQFHELLVCVGQVALQYYALVRAYSIVCGPGPEGGSRVQKGRHNALVRELLLEYHKPIDDAVYTLFDSRLRLRVGKQVPGSSKPVWDEAGGVKSSPLSLIFMREHCSFKTPFSSILYDSSQGSWFNSADPADERVDEATKAAFVLLKEKVLEFARRRKLAVLPSPPGQWWVSFACDVVDVASPQAAAGSSPRTKKSPALFFNAESLSIAGSLASAFQSASAPAVVAPPVGIPVLLKVVERSFDTDRPNHGDCLIVADELAVQALKAGKETKVASRFDCNALGLRMGGSFPKYVHKSSWQTVVDSRERSLKVEAKRRCVTSDFSFNALGQSEDGKNYFQFCTNYETQRIVFPLDEVTPVALNCYCDVDFTDVTVVDDVRRDVMYLREKLGKKRKDVGYDTVELQRKYRNLAKEVNKRGRSDGPHLAIYLDSSGRLFHANEEDPLAF